MTETACLLHSIKHINLNNKNIWIFKLQAIIGLNNDVFYKILEINKNAAEFYNFIYSICKEKVDCGFEINFSDPKYIFIKLDYLGNIIALNHYVPNFNIIDFLYLKFICINDSNNSEDIAFETIHTIYSYMYKNNIITFKQSL